MWEISPKIHWTYRKLEIHWHNSIFIFFRLFMEIITSNILCPETWNPCALCSSGESCSCRATAERAEISTGAELWSAMADWSLLGNFLEEVQEHSTSVGKVWHAHTSMHENTHVHIHTHAHMWHASPTRHQSDFLCTYTHFSPCLFCASWPIVS